ncbi:MAG: hypothetical protein JO356_19120, partial [Acidobacteria bacterium]|nr:hypothetical protein [Acidobacteriota bacterium]
MRRKFWIGITLAGVIPIASLAQKADLSGTWNLNLAKSSMAGAHPWRDYRLTKVIEQKGDTIAITNISVNASIVNIP